MKKSPFTIEQISKYSSREDFLSDAACFYENRLTQLEQQRDELLHALNSAVSQVKYLHDKFQETGSGNGFIAQWEALIAKFEEMK